MYQSWQFWAVISAAFAALTAIFAKIGVENISSNLATLIRTIVILAVTAAIVTANKEWQPPASLAGRTYAFLGLSGAATGASWLCYFRALKLGDAARVAPIDKLSVVLIAVFGVLFLGERLSAWNWLGIGLISAGAIMVAYRADDVSSYSGWIAPRDQPWQVVATALPVCDNTAIARDDGWRECLYNAAPRPVSNDSRAASADRGPANVPVGKCGVGQEKPNCIRPTSVIPTIFIRLSIASGPARRTRRCRSISG